MKFLAHIINEIKSSKLRNVLVTTFYLPLAHMIDEKGVTNPLAKLWTPELLSDPLLFHAMVVTSSTTLDIVRSNSNHRLLRLYHEGELIKEVQKALKDLNRTKYTRDAIVMGVQALASEAGTLMPPVLDSPFNTRLNNLSFMSKYGRIVYDERHGKALYELVMARGGLHNFRLPYLASTISR
jgi:hypothetical protein